MRSCCLILVTHNNYDKLYLCLKSIYNSTSPSMYHLFIIDNASTDSTIGLYGTKLPNTTLIRFNENQWWGGGINAGLRLSKDQGYDYTFFLNNDVEVAPNWLENHIEALQDPAVGAVGPFNSHSRDWQCYDRVRKSFADLKLPEINIERENVIAMNKEINKLNLKSCLVKGMLAFFCVAFRTEVINKIGFLDERFIMGGDDDDYCRRLELAGFSLALLLNTYVVHHAGSSIQRLDSEVYARMKKANVELLQQKYSKYFRG